MIPMENICFSDLKFIVVQRHRIHKRLWKERWFSRFGGRWLPFTTEVWVETGYLPDGEMILNEVNGIIYCYEYQKQEIKKAMEKYNQ